MAITYQIKLKDHDGLVVARFTGGGRGSAGGGLESFVYRKRVRTPGQIQLTIKGNDERIALFDYDYQLEFLRRDPGYLDFYKDFEGFHRDPTFRRLANGTELFDSHGRGYNDLLIAEPILYAAGSSQASKNGAAETVAKSFVDQNIGPNAGLDPLGVSRVRPNLTIETDAGTGSTWRGARAYENLFDVVLEIAEFTVADYMIIGTNDDDSGPASFEFRWADGQWGEDKRRGNTAGNPDVVFSPWLGTVQQLTSRESKLNEINVCYVLGAGAGASRTIQTVQDAVAEGYSPWSRRAVCRDARDEQNTTALTVRGREVLNKFKSKATTDLTAIQTASLRYGPPGASSTTGVVFWSLGDLVTVERTRGEYIDQKISGVVVRMDSNGNETIVPELEDV